MSSPSFPNCTKQIIYLTHRNRKTLFFEVSSTLNKKNKMKKQFLQFEHNFFVDVVDKYTITQCGI